MEDRCSLTHGTAALTITLQARIPTLLLSCIQRLWRKAHNVSLLCRSSSWVQTISDRWKSLSSPTSCLVRCALSPDNDPLVALEPLYLHHVSQSAPS
jgi:hypothetical protein